jgi:hypothetical protein
MVDHSTSAARGSPRPRSPSANWYGSVELPPTNPKVVSNVPGAAAKVVELMNLGGSAVFSA